MDPSIIEDRELIQLGAEECLALLDSEHLGHLGMSIGALPVVLPVNYRLDRHTIVFRSEAGEKLEAARFGAVACLEIDRFDGSEGSGWNVTATGRLRVLDSDEARHLTDIPLSPWALGASDETIELSIELLSGRTIGPANSSGRP